MKETNIIFGKKSFAHKKMKIFLYMLFMGTFLTACGKAEKGNQVTEAVYLGVENYGAEEVNKDTKEDFSYRFEIDGRETILKIDSGAKMKRENIHTPFRICSKKDILIRSILKMAL